METRQFRTTDEVFEYLLGFVNVEKGQKTEFKLDRMRELSDALGRPERAYPSIHVAGSKGKGSVSVMTARILEAAGRKCGLYTSPHLLRWKERISLAGTEMDEDLILRAMAEVLPLVDGLPPEAFHGGELPTYFELTTLVGFLAFRLAGCDAAVIETGLGGRLDSTNIVDSAATIITPIELEHTEWLGDSLAKIAYEKAGIIKPGKPCFLASQPPEAQEVFVTACRERQSPLFPVAEAARIELVGLDRKGTEARIALQGPGPLSEALVYRSPMVASVQAENMALALLAARALVPDLDPATARAGLARASLPARFQILATEPPIVLDGAHTPNSIRICLESFNRLFPGPADLLFACAHDKHHAQMAGILKDRFQEVTITRPGRFKPSEPEAVATSFGLRDGRCRLIDDTAEALAQARGAARAGARPLLVAGSFYLCSEAASAWEP